jgi:hypothetical protein
LLLYCPRKPKEAIQLSLSLALCQQIFAFVNTALGSKKGCEPHAHDSNSCITCLGFLGQYNNKLCCSYLLYCPRKPKQAMQLSLSLALCQQSFAIVNTASESKKDVNPMLTTAAITLLTLDSLGKTATIWFMKTLGLLKNA